MSKQIPARHVMFRAPVQSQGALAHQVGYGVFTQTETTATPAYFTMPRKQINKKNKENEKRKKIKTRKKRNVRTTRNEETNVTKN